MAAASLPLHHLRAYTAPKFNVGMLAASLCAHTLLAMALVWVVHTPAEYAPSTINVSIVSLASPTSAPSPRREKSLAPPPKVLVAPTADHGISLPKPEREQAAASVAAPGSTQGQDASTVIHEAAYRRQIPPRYPSRAFELGQEGTVELHALIEPDGHPQELKIAHSSGYPLLDDAALTAVKRWEFEVAGAAQWVRVPVQFTIQ